MKRQKRETLEVIKDILGVILLNRNIGVTKLIQKANLAGQSFNEYTTTLIKKELITITLTENKGLINDRKLGPGRRIINLTEKGRQYLEDYKAVEMFKEKYGLNE